MQDTAKYLIHADITAAGVVERSDVVGAVFGQTEGLLGDDMDLRDLQDSKKVGRIDVEIAAEGGQSRGEVTVASGLDKVETAILAAALETIEQVGPCGAEITVTNIEDIRSAKRREVVDRATELLAQFEADSVTTEDIVETVRQRVRVEDVTEYDGFPAGPRVADSDAIVVVEGRADVVQLLKYGVKNAIAVEGTDVPDTVADLTADRTVTAFLDGDRGGDLILKELGQVGEIDYVALAPRGQSVEDLSRADAMTALRDKIPYEEFVDGADGESSQDSSGTARADGPVAVDPTPPAEGDERSEEGGAVAVTETVETPAADETGATPDAESTAVPETLSDHVAAVIGAGTGQARLLGPDGAVLADGDADDTVSLVAESETVPETVVLDGPCSQKVLDVAAQRGVDVVVATEHGEYVKQPTSVHVRIEDGDQS
ncbi:DNA primase DnaG [Halomicroarcula sp. GCM10025709]|uniref:DNA primase DnaG n=1 Tax=Haloarcula TaxID=2237 RepID=UPI0024C3C44E|nr:DNA primase DnaG [Halomicroarcula sp. YJ-61-S]